MLRSAGSRRLLFVGLHTLVLGVQRFGALDDAVEVFAVCLKAALRQSGIESVKVKHWLTL
jgi:hypothetical protein